MADVCTSWRETLALKDIATGVVEVLHDSDLPVLYEDVDFSFLNETRRWFMLIFMFRTGLRPESLGPLLVDSVVIREENGEPIGYLEFGLGGMKNLLDSLAKVDAALLKQRVHPCPGARVCARDAYAEQCTLLPQKTGYIFRSVNRLSHEMLEDEAGYGMFHGAAEWAGKVLKRPALQAKDLGRRAVVTKLVHANLPAVDIAKDMGIHEMPVSVYRRAHPRVSKQRVCPPLGWWLLELAGVGREGCSIGVKKKMQRAPQKWAKVVCWVVKW